jgi:hypothetical protein
MNPDPSNPLEPFPREAIPPEMLAWARQTFDEEEFLADIRDIGATGGCGLKISSPNWKRRPLLGVLFDSEAVSTRLARDPGNFIQVHSDFFLAWEKWCSRNAVCHAFA